MQIDIRPEVNILGVLSHLNYKPWYALAEFVDNALGSFLAHRDDLDNATLGVWIDIDDADGGLIEIRDNAAGIAVEDFPRAFRAAQTPPDGTGLSEFGMGMKSAASWFAKSWTVTTSVSGESVARRVSFDLASITASNKSTLEVEELDADPSEHFTVVTLTNLNHIPQTKTVAKIRAHLAGIYRKYLRDGDLALTFKKDLVTFTEVQPLKKPAESDPDGPEIEWRKSIRFRLESGRTVEGFAGIRNVGSTSEAGFALFRRGRLILGSHDDAYRPSSLVGRSNSYLYQRLYGELTLVGFDVSHTKDGFQWDDEEEQFIEQLRESLEAGEKNLIAEANAYRPNLTRRAVRSVELAATAVASAIEERLEPVVAAALEAAVVPEDLPEYEVSVTDPDDTVIVGAVVERVASVQIGARLWRVEVVAKTDDSSHKWLAVGATVDGSDEAGSSTSSVAVTLNLSHPFTKKYLGATNDGIELMMSIACAVGLALALAKQDGAKSYSVLRHLNDLTRRTFSGLHEELK